MSKAEQNETPQDNVAESIEQACNRQVMALREQLRQMTAERDAALAKVETVITERDAAERERTESRAEVVQLQADRDAVSEQLARCREDVDVFLGVNTALLDTIRQLRAKQVNDDLPGILCAIQLAVQQARELI